MLKKTTFFVLICMLIFAFLSCNLTDVTKDSGSLTIQILDQANSSRAISVNEYPVIGLLIEITGPTNTNFEWVPGDDTFIELTLPMGYYSISITHFYVSDENGNVESIMENSAFTIQAMVTTIIEVIPGAIGGLVITDQDPVPTPTPEPIPEPTPEWEILMPVFDPYVFAGPFVDIMVDIDPGPGGFIRFESLLYDNIEMQPTEFGCRILMPPDCIAYRLEMVVADYFCEPPHWSSEIMGEIIFGPEIYPLHEWSVGEYILMESPEPDIDIHFNIPPHVDIIDFMSIMLGNIFIYGLR